MSATDDLRAHAKAALGAPIQRATHPTPCPRCPVRAEMEAERDSLQREVERLRAMLGKVPQEQVARIMQAVDLEALTEATDGSTR